MLRLTGGEFRGRFIATVPGNEIARPTQSRLRQALFNSIQAEIPDARVLDLFAGSGALGFEALSRGAASVAFVERSSAAVKILGGNIEELGVGDRAQIARLSVDQYFRGNFGAPFDLILADPPYEAGWERRLLEEAPWERLVVPEGLFILEWGSQKSKVHELPDRRHVLVKVREKNYGDSMLTTYRRASESAS